MSVDLNQSVQKASDDLHATLQQAQQTLAALSQLIAKIEPLADTVQAVLSEAVTVEKDADNVIKSVKIHWPL
jgi:ABC-type transporter Mla subunit MlaD